MPPTWEQTALFSRSVDGLWIQDGGSRSGIGMPLSLFCFPTFQIDGFTRWNWVPINSFQNNAKTLTLPTSFALEFSVWLRREAWEQRSPRKRGQAGILQRVPLHACSLGEFPRTVLQASHRAGERGDLHSCSPSTTELHDGEPHITPSIVSLEKKNKKPKLLRCLAKH